ncbi:MAG: ribosomal protein S18-alanine N-acetyltransferase [Oleiphilaceae bacterium]|nr:ribosomal protein S18-alanine N-acetyltransferase [Oleiphilaceae bacterium]
MSEPIHAVSGKSRQVRALHLDDLDAVLDIERQGYSHPWTPGVFRDCFHANYRTWALTEDKEVIGYAVVAYMVDEAHLLNLCVARRHHRSGGARYLLRHLIAQARQENMSRVLLEVRLSNEPAVTLYNSEGFEQIGIRPQYYPAVRGRESARVMALVIA